jgi:predicted kinase
MSSTLHPFLIIITGRPAAGKSTLANWLAGELKIPVISKDRMREMLFDRLGWGDRAWASLLGRATIDLMFYFAHRQLESGYSIIMDNAFHPASSAPRFLALQAQTRAEMIQIVCNADSETLFQRFKDRAENGNRHPGHGDAVVLDELRQHLAAELSPVMEIGGVTIELDTKDFSEIAYQKTLRQVKKYMNSVIKLT